MKEKFIVNECYAPLENAVWFIKETADRMDRAGYKLVSWSITLLPEGHAKYSPNTQTHLFCMLGELKDGHTNNDTAKP